MTNYVIDANVLMSILISGKAAYRPILNYYNFIIPDFALVEIDKYRASIEQRTKLNAIELRQWTYAIFQEVTVLPSYVLERSLLEKAHNLVKSVDEKDITYVALSMQLDLFLITRDKPLHAHLRKQGFRKVILFDTFLQNI